MTISIQRVWHCIDRDEASRQRGGGAVVLGDADEGQIPAEHTAGAEPEHGATHPGHVPKVRSKKRSFKGATSQIQLIRLHQKLILVCTELVAWHTLWLRRTPSLCVVVSYRKTVTTQKNYLEGHPLACNINVLTSSLDTSENSDVRNFILICPVEVRCWLHLRLRWSHIVPCCRLLYADSSVYLSNKCH